MSLNLQVQLNNGLERVLRHTDSKKSLVSLPTEVFQKILLQLDYKTQNLCACVNRYFRDQRKISVEDDNRYLVFFLENVLGIKNKSDLEKLAPYFLALQNIKNDRKTKIRKLHRIIYEYFKYKINSSFNNRVICAICVTRTPHLFSNLSNELKNDPIFLKAILIKFGQFLEYIPKKFQNDPELVLAAVSEDGLALCHASNDLKNNRKIVLAAVRQDGLALKYASVALQNDLEIVLAAVNQFGLALYHASDELKNNRMVVLAAVRQEGIALKFASNRLKKNRKIVLAAVNQNGLAIIFVDKIYANDRKVVLAAVNQDGQALGCISDSMKNDSTIVLSSLIRDTQDYKAAVKIVKMYPKAIAKAIIDPEELGTELNELKINPRNVVNQLSRQMLAMQTVAKMLRLMYPITAAIIPLAAMRKKIGFKYAFYEFKNIKVMVEHALNQYRSTLYYASETKKKDRDLTLIGVTQIGMSLNGSWLTDDPEIVLAAVNRDGKVLSFACPYLLEKHPEIVLAAVRQNGMALRFAYRFKNDEKIVLAAVSENGCALKYASDALKNNFTIVLAAAIQNRYALDYASDAMKKNEQIAYIVKKLHENK